MCCIQWSENKNPTRFYDGIAPCESDRRLKSVCRKMRGRVWNRKCGTVCDDENWRLHNHSKQGSCIYSCYFALQNACWEIPNPFGAAPFRRRLRDGIAELHKSILEYRREEKTAKQIKSTVPFWKTFYYAAIALALTCLQRWQYPLHLQERSRNQGIKEPPHHRIYSGSEAVFLWCYSDCVVFKKLL